MTAPSDPATRAGRLWSLARTTAFRLTLVYVALFVASAALTGLLLIWRTNEILSEQVLRALTAERDELLRSAEVQGLETMSRLIAERSRITSGTLYFLADPRGARLAGNLSQHPPELAGLRAGGLFTYASPARAGERQRLAVGTTTPIQGGGRLVLARDVEDQRRLLEAMRRLFLWSFAALALAGLVGGILASRMVLKRIEAVSATSRRIMAGELGERVPTTGSGDEIDDLAANLNSMLERIEQLMRGLQEVSDNIAHDLKTPLSRLRSRAEAALRDARGGPAWRDGLERTIEDADELIRTFNALLLIARLEAGSVAASYTTFDLAEAVRDIAELYTPAAEDAGGAIAVSEAGELLVSANRELIVQAVANLIDNALKYGHIEQGGEPVRVELAASPAGIEVTVRDRGPGIAATDRERAQRRFVRLDDSRSRPGTGLGLSLVAAVVRLHGGTLRLADNAPGLAVTLVLPARLVVSR